MKKRTIALLTTLTLATGMVAGCGSNNTAADTATDTVKTSEAASEKTEATETVESTEVDDQAAADHVAELIDAIHQNPDNGEQAADLLMVSKYLERIGDHATNIAEWVIFSITGNHPGQENSKGKYF